MRKLFILSVLAVLFALTSTISANDWYYEYSNAGTHYQETINAYDAYWVFGDHRTISSGMVNKINTSGSLAFSKQFQVNGNPTSCYDAIVGTFSETDDINTGFFVTGEVEISSIIYPYFGFVNELGNMNSYRIIYDLPGCRGLEIVQAQNGNIVMVAAEIQGNDTYLLRHSLTGSSPICIHSLSDQFTTDYYMLPTYLLHIPDKIFPDELFVVGGSAFWDDEGVYKLSSSIMIYSGTSDIFVKKQIGFTLPLTETWIQDGCLGIYYGEPMITTIGQANVPPYDVNVFRRQHILYQAPFYYLVSYPPNKVILPGHGIINDISHVHGEPKFVGFADDYNHNKEICFVDMNFVGDTFATIHHGNSGDNYGFIHGFLIDNGYVVAGYNHDNQKLAICRNDNVWPQNIEPLVAHDQSQIEDLHFTNPVSDRATISFAIRETGRVNIEVFDMTGRMVDLVVDQTLPSGEHTIIWEPSSNISNGTYFLRIKTPNNTSNNQFILIR